MTRLPETITLGNVTLHRVRPHKGRPTNEWCDEHNWNELEYRKGKWLFQGSPLSVSGVHVEWRDTPQEAYLANLEHQRIWLHRRYNEDLREIDDAIREHLQDGALHR